RRPPRPPCPATFSERPVAHAVRGRARKTASLLARRWCVRLRILAYNAAARLSSVGELRVPRFAPQPWRTGATRMRSVSRCVRRRQLSRSSEHTPLRSDRRRGRRSQDGIGADTPFEGLIFQDGCPPVRGKSNHDDHAPLPHLLLHDRRSVSGPVFGRCRPVASPTISVCPSRSCRASASVGKVPHYAHSRHVSARRPPPPCRGRSTAAYCGAAGAACCSSSHRPTAWLSTMWRQIRSSRRCWRMARRRSRQAASSASVPNGSHHVL